ncbi:MAG: hypothetical protein JNM07_13870 [Phycisphaerae bacterium]|nr:hypothetical protein [Phycisphaerae bacterium]
MNTNGRWRWNGAVEGLYVANEPKPVAKPYSQSNVAWSGSAPGVGRFICVNQSAVSSVPHTSVGWYTPLPSTVQGPHATPTGCAKYEPRSVPTDRRA